MKAEAEIIHGRATILVTLILPNEAGSLQLSLISDGHWEIDARNIKDVEAARYWRRFIDESLRART